MTFSHEQAAELAMSALLHVLQIPDLASGFMGTTGLRPEDLRQLSGQPELAIHVLDYLLEDDARVIDAAEALQVRAADFLTARTALAGPGSFGWEAD
ncbi:DUF3572 family protein [Paracoccus sp. 11-3]|uniref:DUF3572 family protein n=1 Tax=Paracoccus amoyensis TaxID=2760093 RepID=A0A926JBA5_9RHOB|nr:DUF3572 family protein [Paracoccus amoyensis]MBC9245635.1 DUF3572 family protein [Paracoccus amoyensis]